MYPWVSPPQLNASSAAIALFQSSNAQRLIMSELFIVKDFRRIKPKAACKRKTAKILIKMIKHLQSNHSYTLPNGIVVNKEVNNE